MLMLSGSIDVAFYKMAMAAAASWTFIFIQRLACRAASASAELSCSFCAISLAVHRCIGSILCVCVCLCVLGTTVSCAKTAELSWVTL